MQISLTGRLLCAAQQTYEIRTTGVTPPSPPTPAPPPSTLVGFVNPPPCFVDGVDGINAGLVGSTDTEIIVAFRGTEPFDSPDRGQMILDWLNDADAALVAEPGMPGLVHQGFRDALDSVWAAMWPQIQALTAANPKAPLYITGHSKGGAMAPLAAMRCQAAGLNPYVCTFAAARCGDQAFADGYNAAVTHSVRYEYQDDIVPHLPPEDALIELFKKIPFLAQTASGLTTGYASVGDLCFINWSDQVVGDSSVLEFDRLLNLSKLLVTGGFEKVIDDHSIAPGSGYASVICPGVWS
jgi:hypothetical protein